MSADHVSDVIQNVGVLGSAPARFARDSEHGLAIDTGERAVGIPHSPATGESLVSNGALGADIIRLAAGDRFAPHIHAGDHLLLILAGQGTLAVGGEVRPTRPGEIHLVPGQVPHAVGAITDHVLLAVGSPHAPLDSADRMTLRAYDAVLSVSDDLTCHICGRHAVFPARLHDFGCPHCPCERCADIEQQTVVV